MWEPVRCGQEFNVYPLEFIKNPTHYKHCGLDGQNKDEAPALKAVDKTVVSEIFMLGRGHAHQ